MKMLRTLFKPKKPSLPAHPSKTFRGDLKMLNQKLASNEPFALSRYGDGEMMVINGDAIDLSKKYHGEHRYQPDNLADEKQRALLTSALNHQASNYYVAIACPCCVGVERFQLLKSQSNQPEEQLTWANIFVNSNYDYFRRETIPLIAKKDNVYFIGHSNGNTDGLSFNIKRHFKTGGNAWVDDYPRLTREITEELSTLNSNATLIFCAGVLSNLLIFQLSQDFPEHTYLDCGSVFDIDLGLGKTRKYLKKGKTLKKTCVWI